MKSATRLLWLDYWASKVDPNYEYSVIQYEKGKDGYWTVEIKLPHYDKLIVQKSKKLIAALMPATLEACLAVNNLMDKNPDLRVENKYIDGHWVMRMDEDDEGFTIMQSDEYHKETEEIRECLTDALSHQSGAILHTISRWIGTTDLAYFHIFDKRLFGKDNKEIMKNMSVFIDKFHKGPSNARTFISGDSVIAFGFKMDIR